MGKARFFRVCQGILLDGHREESGTREAWAPPGWGVWGPVTGAWGPTHPRACPKCAELAAGSFASSSCTGHCGLTDKDAFRCDLEKTCPVGTQWSASLPSFLMGLHVAGPLAQLLWGDTHCFCMWGGYPGQGGEEDPLPHVLIQVGEEPPALSRCSDMEALDIVPPLSLLPPHHFRWWE